MNGNIRVLFEAPSNKKGIKKVDYLDLTSFEAGLLNLVRENSLKYPSNSTKKPKLRYETAMKTSAELHLPC